MATNNQFPKVDTDETTRNVVQIKSKHANTLKGVKVQRQDFLSDGESSEAESVRSADLVQKMERPKSSNRPQNGFESNKNYSSQYDYPKFGKGSFEAFANPKKGGIEQDDEEDEEDDIEYESEEEDSDNDENQENSDNELDEAASQASSDRSVKNYMKREEQKKDILIKLQTLQKKGYELSKNYTLRSDLSEMKFEYEKIKREIEVQSSIRFSRRALMACVTGLEFMNKKFDPFSVHLDGWSENVMENMDDYDNVFERLHDKYKGKAEMAPEIELLMMLGGSAFMFHLTQSLFKSSIPAVTQMTQNNPNFLKNITQAMQDSIGQKPQGGPPAPQETRSAQGNKEMRGPSLDPGLFSNIMSGMMGGMEPQIQPQKPSQEFQPKEVPLATNTQYIPEPEEDDRFSVASTSDGTESSVSAIDDDDRQKTVLISNSRGRGRGRGGGGRGRGRGGRGRGRGELNLM
jgi:hypothetical protein